VRKSSDLALLAGSDVRLVTGDLRDKGSLLQAVRGADYVFHLAAVIRAGDWNTYYESNYVGTKNLIEVCAERGRRIRRFVFVSSISAAGPSIKGVLKGEEAEPRPITWYGISKLMAEDAVKALAGKVPFVILRPPNVLGPGGKEFYSVLKLLKMRIMPLLGNGDEQTSIIFVQDLVRGIEQAALHRGIVSETYYLTDGRIYSWRGITGVIAGHRTDDDAIQLACGVARRNKAKVYGYEIDIRGQGGYVIVPPSSGYKIIMDGNMSTWERRF
jgi:nucleoside-diphosphate-sugar epimerase